MISPITVSTLPGELHVQIGLQLKGRQRGPVDQREELLAAVQTRIVRAAAGDPTSVLAPQALTEARQLAGTLSDDGDLVLRYWLGWLHWCRCQAVPGGRDRMDLDAAIRMSRPASSPACRICPYLCGRPSQRRQPR